MKGKRYTARELLAIWALRIQGGRLTKPAPVSTQGDADPVEEEMLIVQYVESTPGFWDAREILKWVHVSHHPAFEFDPRLPGESLDYALGRLGWKQYQGYAPGKIGPAIEKAFMKAFEQRCADEPFVFRPEWEETVTPLRVQPA